MLIQKPQEVPYISIFKSNSGEEFIGKVVEETTAEYKVKSPLCMISTERGFQFAPFIMMADPDKSITVPKPVITGVPADKLLEQYEQAITPIQLIKR